MAKEKTHYVYSTLANDQAYTNYTEAASGPNDLPSTLGSVLIKGGAGVADKRGETYPGVVTEVDDDELAILEANSEFRAHRTRGHILVTGRDEKIEKVTSSMNRDDPSGPITSMDYKDQNPGNTAPMGDKAPKATKLSGE